MVRQLRPVLTALEEAAQEGLVEAARYARDRSQELVPVDTGALRRSVRVVADDLSVTVKYTNPIAWLIHERTEWKHPNGGQAKFLETAALEVDVGAIVARKTRATFGG